jgi:polysaccharide deacetylase family protein (PEP-CTERM system associated)
MIENNKIFLFSLDVEDVRIGSVNGLTYTPRVAINSQIYLNWLSKNRFKGTFFVVGEVAKMYPSLINEIISEGHEIGCHTMQHKILSQYTEDEFKKDLADNVSTLISLGATNITGFRAPSYSLKKDTQWVYKILKELGFLYSSSVLPAKNPLYTGWPEFGRKSKIAAEGILEIPLTINRVGPFLLPVVGGIYFRALPRFVLKRFVRLNAANEPLVGYFHPFDVDSEQERFMQGGINNNKLYNWLMYYNRGSVIDKLNSIIDQGFRVITYREYINSCLK